MKKRIGKKTLAKEAVFWGRMKNALSRSELRTCLK
jgi:hypothetical protein